MIAALLSKKRCSIFGHWKLVIGHSLVIGHWSLVILSSLSIGCATVPRTQLERAQDENAELENQRDRTNERFSRFEHEYQRSRQEVSRLNDQVTGEREVNRILDQRVQNLRQQYDRLNHQMTEIVMNAAGNGPSSPLRSVNGPRYLDFELPTALARELEIFATHHAVTFDHSGKVCRFSSRRMFDSNGDGLRIWARDALRKLAEILRSSDAAHLNIMIVGHTTELPEFSTELASIHPTDWHLAAHQAIAVEQYLEECGIASSRMGIISYAGQQPLHQDQDPRNARLEIYFIAPDPVISNQ